MHFRAQRCDLVRSGRVRHARKAAAVKQTLAESPCHNSYRAVPSALSNPLGARYFRSAQPRADQRTTRES